MLQKVLMLPKPEYRIHLIEKMKQEIYKIKTSKQLPEDRVLDGFVSTLNRLVEIEGLPSSKKFKVEYK